VIFLTVGTQLPFDRLVSAVDKWASDSGAQVFAQTCSESRWNALDSTPTVTPARARALFSSADVVVSHAGMGSILTALELEKPIIIFPRRAALGEHRNEHQLATAKKFSGRTEGVYVAFDEAELIELLTNTHKLRPSKEFSSYADKAMIEAIRALAFAPR